MNKAIASSVASAWLLLAASMATPASAQPAIPDTPAGRTLRTWLDVFDSGARGRMEVYVTSVDKTQSVDGMIAFRNQTGGFDLVSIESSEPLRIRFLVKEKGSATTAIGSFVVQDGQPPTVKSFSLRALPPGATVENVTLDAALRRRVIDGVAADLTEDYVDAKLADAMVKSLRAKEAAGAYDKIDDGDVFAAQLTDDLRAVSHDLHLNVGFVPFKLPAQAQPSAEDIARGQAAALRQNCAFDKVEILPGNIGYLKFDAFRDPAVCAPTVAAAMGFVAHADALIFDLRDNHGGDPDMVTLIASYLFKDRTHLNDLYNRKENTTTQFWTTPWLPGARMATQPVFVLTSKGTFSGGEEFAYDLKMQKRATLVGETTGGGAHPIEGRVVADYFTITVPVASAINPISKTDWEGVGVVPDVAVPAPEALSTAQKLALAAVQGK